MSASRNAVTSPKAASPNTTCRRTPADKRRVEQVERMLPFRRKRHRVGHARRATPRAIGRPRLRADRAACRCSHSRARRRDADSWRSDNCPCGRACPSTVARRPRSGGPSSESRYRRRRTPSPQATRDRACGRARANSSLGIPGTHHHALLQTLPHRLDLIRAVDQAGGDRLDALPLAIEQQAGDVLRHRRPALGPTEVRGQRVDERRQLAIQALQCVWRHTRNRSRPDRGVKSEVTRYSL